MKKIILTFLFFCFFASLFILGYGQGKPVDENKEKVEEIVQEKEVIEDESPLFRGLTTEERKKRIESFKKLDSQEIKYEEKKLTQKENTKKEHEVALTKVLLDIEQGLNPKDKYEYPGLEKFKTMNVSQIDTAIFKYEKDVLKAAQGYANEISMKKEMLFQMEEILKKENQKIILVLIDYLNEKYNSQDAAMEMWRQKRQSDLEILEFLGQENRESYRKFRKNITPGDGEYFFMGEAD